MAITVPEPNKHYAMAALLPFPLAPESGLIVQYEAQTAQTHGCGGAYMKLLSPPDGWAPQRLRSRTPYSIMFGPDRCGAAARVHLILKCFNPALGATTEHHLASPPPPPNDRLPHIYTLMLSKEGRYRVLIDGEERAAGGLLDDGAFEPPLRPPKRIPDASDEKPLAWDEREEIDDVRAVKPSDWDNRKMIVDPDAVMPAGWLEGEPTHLLDEGVPKPRDWDDARDGVWMPPEIENPRCKSAPGCGPWRPLKRNPNYKGVWLPPRIKNPNYQGEWKPRLIKNPAYFEGQSVDAPLKRIAPIRAVAFEIWTTDKGYLFDGVLVAPEEGGAEAAEAYRLGVWRRRYWEEYGAAETAHRRSQIAQVPAPARWIMLAFESEPLAQLRAAAVPVLEQLYARPWLAYVVLLLPPAGAVLLVGWLRRRQGASHKGRTSAAGAARRQATIGAQTAAAEGAEREEERSEEEGDPPAGARSPEAGGEDGAGEAAGDAGGGGAAAIRRRPRRA